MAIIKKYHPLAIWDIEEDLNQSCTSIKATPHDKVVPLDTIEVDLYADLVIDHSANDLKASGLEYTGHEDVTGHPQSRIEETKKG
jgi:hypothetical protein